MTSSPRRFPRREIFFALILALIAVISGCRSAARAREHVEKGNQYFGQKQFSAAESEYRQAIQISPDYADAYYHLGLLQIQQEHPSAASQSLLRAVDLDPKNSDARLKLGDLMVSSTQYIEARQQADAVLKQDARNAAAHRLLGEIALHQMQYADAENELKQAISLDPRDQQTYEILGLTQLLDAENGAAEKSFQTAVDIRPDDPQTFINLADYYKGQNVSDRAEQVLRQGMARDPRAVELPIALAGLYFERSRGDEAKHVLGQIEADANDYPDGRRAVANVYLENGDATAALERFRSLAAKDSSDQAAAKKVAECRIQLAHWQEAEQWLDQRDRDRKDPDFRLLRARVYLGAFRLREARAELEGLIKDSPDLPAVYFYLAQVDIAQEQALQAQQALIEALKIQPGYLPALLGLGNISLQQNEAAAALSYASRVIATSFWVADAHVIAGSSYLMQGDLTQAQRAFELAAGLNPRSPAPEERLGKVLAMRGQNADAEKAYESSLAIAPDYAPALRGVAEVLAKEGKSKQAGARIDQQIAKQPKAYQLYVDKAEFCIAQKDWNCAERFYQQTLQLNPYYVNGYLALAHIYAATNRPQGMIQAYESARSKFPEYIPTYLLLGQVYEYVGNVEQARQVYQDAIKVDPNSYQCLSSLARLYADHGGSLTDALELAQKAKTLQPDDPGVNDTLGWVYYKQGLYRSAVPALEAAVAKNPQAKFQYHLGMAYLAAGQAAQAHSSLQAALQSGLSGEEARSAQDALQKAGS
ncbi:MAG TPA: tetratricopeptide repeat protein [Candidatus Binatia bacterium]|nr:tetratricopeptide repeat protein [Candidatus Binatia bacterium]